MSSAADRCRAERPACGRGWGEGKNGLIPVRLPSPRPSPQAGEGDWFAPSMLDLSHDPAAPAPIRLADYRPPDFLIDTVDLRFELDEKETRVVSRLALRRNPDAADRSAP